MTDLNTINQQRRDLLNQRAAAQQAEQARLAAERQNLDTIGAVDQELAHLDALERAERFQQAVQQNQALVDQNQETARQLAAEMNQAVDLLRTIQGSALANQVQRLFEQQQQHAIRAASTHTAQSAPWPWYGRDESTLTREERRQMQAYGEQQRKQEWDAWSQFKTAWPLHVVVAQYISQAPDPETRRLRQLVGFIFVGELLNPSPNYSANAAVAEIQRQNWRA